MIVSMGCVAGLSSVEHCCNLVIVGCKVPLRYIDSSIGIGLIHVHTADHIVVKPHVARERPFAAFP